MPPVAIRSYPAGARQDYSGKGPPSQLLIVRAPNCRNRRITPRAVIVGEIAISRFDRLVTERYRDFPTIIVVCLAVVRRC